MSPHECGLRIHYSSCQGLIVYHLIVASPPLLKYLPTPLVGNPIIKILDTPLREVSLLNCIIHATVVLYRYWICAGNVTFPGLYTSNCAIMGDEKSSVYPELRKCP